MLKRILLILFAWLFAGCAEIQENKTEVSPEPVFTAPQSSHRTESQPLINRFQKVDHFQAKDTKNQSPTAPAFVKKNVPAENYAENYVENHDEEQKDILILSQEENTIILVSNLLQVPKLFNAEEFLNTLPAPEIPDLEPQDEYAVNNVYTNEGIDAYLSHLSDRNSHELTFLPQPIFLNETPTTQPQLVLEALPYINDDFSGLPHHFLCHNCTDYENEELDDDTAVQDGPGGPYMPFPFPGAHRF